MKKLTVILFTAILAFTLGATTSFVNGEINDSSGGQLKIKIIGAQGASLINNETSVEHLNSNHATTQIIANEYGVPGSPNETLSISDVPEGVSEIIIHINKSIQIP